MGNPRSSFYAPDLKSEEDFRKMVVATRNDIPQVLAKAGWSGSADDLLNALSVGTPGELTIATNTTLPFMAMRRRGVPDAARDVVYTGEPLEAYYIDFESGGKGYRFIAPKICSNFWIEDRELPAPPAPPPPEPEPTPPPAPAPEVEAPPPPDVEPEVEGPGLFFIGAFVGKERRVFLEEDFIPGFGAFADCTTILGVKAGVLPRLGDNAELELALGGKFVISDDDDVLDDINDIPGVDIDDGGDNSLFADAAIHALFDGGFVGGGVSFWDLTDSDLRTLSLLLQLGFGSDTVQFSVESRIPFEELDDIGNNYMFWGGVRIRP